MSSDQAAGDPSAVLPENVQPIGQPATTPQADAVAVLAGEYDPASKPVSATSEHNVQVHRMYKESGVLTHEEFTDDHIIQVRAASENIEMARVSAASSMTLNLGNFESVKVEVTIQLPCYVEEVTDCYKAAKAIVDLHLNGEVAAIRAYRESKGKPENHGG